MLSRKLLNIITGALEDIKAADLQQLDVRGRTSITDCMVIGSGTSVRHVKSLADTVVRECKKAGFRPVGIEGQDTGEWVLVDMGDVVVHIMMPEIRAFYQLERLWSVDDQDNDIRVDQAHS